MKNQLLDILRSTVSPGRFYASGQLPDVELKLDVKGVGAVRMPVAPRRAKQMIARSQQAPYGRGSETLVDTSVRKVWELGPRKFKILSPEWKTHMSNLLPRIAQQFGLEGETIKAQLYKLLIYEPGSFFLPHQDTEKTDGMFATLIIALPSQHTGGTLIVGHNGEQKKLSFGGKKSATILQYLSFYADCSHEVKPLISGYRICLVYNLSLKQRTSRQILDEAALQPLTELLQTWAAQSPIPSKQAILFDHQYTAAQLSLKHLKGKDFVDGQLLYEAAQKADCEAHLALLSYHESGMPAGGYDSYNGYYGRRGRWYDDDEDDDIDVDAEMEEIFVQGIEVLQWFTPNGRKKKLGHIAINEDEINAHINFKDRPADQSEYEGYMGNYGPSLDRWYHRAALVIWPKTHTFSILVQAGPSGSVPDLVARIKQMDKTKKKDEKADRLQQAQSYASAIIAHGNFPSAPSGEKNTPLKLMLEWLPALRDETLAKEFFQTVFIGAFRGDEGPSLTLFLDACGWKNYQDELVALFEDHAHPATRLAQLLKGLAETPVAEEVPAEADTLVVLKTMADRFARNLKALDESNEAQNSCAFYDGNDTNKQRIELIKMVVEYCCPLFTSTALTDLVRYFTTTPVHYPLHEVLIPLLQHYAKHSRTPAVNDLIQQIQSFLQQRTAQPIAIPDHWEMQASWNCDCRDCAMLKEFLTDPKEQTLHVGMGKERRKHMHRIIERYVIDVNHKTIRRGSPFTLVFEKNRDSYRERQKLWQKEREILKDYSG